MNLKVLYIGNDLKYWGKLKKRFLSVYDEIELEFLQEKVDENIQSKKLFTIILDKRPEIIYLDFSIEFTEVLRLAKLITRNNETRLFSLVGLFEYLDAKSKINMAVSASVRLNHIKCSEIQDVVYNPISLLDVNMALMDEYVRSKEIENIEILQILRVGYVESNRFHVETNSKLNIGDIVDVESHPISGIMPSKKVYIEKFYDRDQYYNRRFSYDLEFIYIDNDFFTTTNDRWKLYKQLKESPDKIQELPEIERVKIIEDMAKRKLAFSPIKNSIDTWMEQNIGATQPKKLKIMVVDETLNIFNAMKSSVEEFPYSINFQTILLGEYYQILRSMPHLLVFRFSENNTEEVLKAICVKIDTIEKYRPYLLVFNSVLSSTEIQKQFGYPNVLAYNQEVKMKNIKDMAIVLDKKLHISESENKVFFRSSAPESTMFIKLNAKVTAMTESIMYIKTKFEIPMWTVFALRSPIPVLLTVVPHKEGGEFSSEENVYRCLINGVGEQEKSKIRMLINSTLSEDE